MRQTKWVIQKEKYGMKGGIEATDSKDRIFKSKKKLIFSPLPPSVFLKTIII
jgi:hypothetical protein